MLLFFLYICCMTHDGCFGPIFLFIFLPFKNKNTKKESLFVFFLFYFIQPCFFFTCPLSLWFFLGVGGIHLSMCIKYICWNYLIHYLFIFLQFIYYIKLRVISAFHENLDDLSPMTRRRFYAQNSPTLSHKFDFNSK